MRRILMFAAVAALVCASEVDENEQKKRGAGKTTSLNAIPTGAQKPEYTYSIYSQNPQSNPSPSYQTQVPNSFYPNQGSNQYYTSPTEASPQYHSQPQINLVPPQTNTQFVPINFIPNPGYQAKYQIIPSKPQSGNIQLAIIPQTQSFQSPSVVQYPQYFSPTSQQVTQQPIHGQYNLQNYQLPISSPYLGHPSMFFLQPNHQLYNNLLYPNPVQSFYNYYPTNSQPKYVASVPPPSPEYEKIQGPVSQSVTKDDNDLSVHSTEYNSPDISSYKTYASNRPSYSKL